MTSRLITGLTPRREQRSQERLLLSISARFELAIRKEIARAMRDINKNGDDAISTHETRMFNLISRLYHVSFTEFGGRLWSSIQNNYKSMQLKDSVPKTPQYDLARQIWVRSNAANRVTQIAGTTLSQAHEIIRIATEKAIEEGLDEKDTAKLIREYISNEGGNLSVFRSRMISRTETHSASNASQQMTAKASGLPLKKRWIASVTERTRESHAIANGQEVGLDEPFTVGYSLMMQPGDTSAPAEEVINCRCVVAYSL